MYQVTYNSFSEDTEILTKNGFIKITELTNKHHITIKNKNGFIEYHQYTEKNNYSFKGDVYQLVNNDIDIIILPDFKIQLDNDVILPINNKIHEYNIPKWIGWRTNTESYNNIEWIRFFGYFHTSGRIMEDVIIIDNIYRGINLYETLYNLPFEWKLYNNDSVIIEDKVLVEYIRRYHIQNDKLIIPEKLKMSSVIQILIFLKILFNNNWCEFYSSDFDYISDIQQLVIKSGSNANIYMRKLNEYRLIHVNDIVKFPKPILHNNCELSVFQLKFNLDYLPRFCIRRNGKAIICNTNYL